jgi:hypothetical protein
MTARDTFVTVSNGDQLNQGYFNGILSNTANATRIIQDQAARSITGITETRIGGVTCNANTVTNGVLIIASGDSYNDTAAGTHTINLRCGTNANGTSNTAQKTIARRMDTTARNSGPWTITYYVSGLTWSSTNYMTITANNSQATGVTTFESLVVIPM